MKGNNTYINKLNVIGSVNTVHYNERLIHLKPEPEFCGILQGCSEFIRRILVKSELRNLNLLCSTMSGVKFTYIYK